MKKSEKKLWKCLNQIWTIREEISSYAFLFQSFQDIETKDQKFYGVGMALNRISEQLEEVHNKIDQIWIEL